MATNRNASSKSAAAKKTGSKPKISFETARLLAPTQGQAEHIAENFGLSLPDYDSVKDAHSEALHNMAKSFDGSLNEKATMMHFQRIVGAVVSSAVGAGRFYSQKVTEARTAAARTAEGGEEPDAPVGFESKARRLAEFAADMAMQSHAILAAAHGAVEAYKEITGEDWIAYEAPAEDKALEQRSLKTQISAFDA
ncbi:hypothetical protein [uncultured Rhodoblastus sp.]|uniref:hypothetical protein n=1 Tax=uncultured Rhodoblastus sp. TaxID=543037 RepID=UPI0025F88E0B|nr:hypothetical protein [uncultured Rhodoblastus sp.]